LTVSRRPGRPRLLREINDRAALDLLLEHGSVTRTQLVEATGLSKPTATQLLVRLEAAGLVTMTGTAAGARGPSAEVYAINSQAGYTVGVDVAPRRIVAAVADITGKTIGTATAPANMKSSPQPASEVVGVIRQAAAAAHVSMHAVGHVAIASPGVHDSDRDLIKHAEHMPAWARPGVLDALRRGLRVPVTIENDVNVVAVAERRHGAARGVNSFALLWVSSGLGLAIDLGGAVHRGATGGAGEVGYMPLPGFGRPRNGGRAFEFQELVSGSAVVALARENGIRARTADVAVRRAAESRETGCSPLLQELADRLATGIAMIVSVLDPELIVLSGDTMVAGGEHLRAPIEHRLHALTPLRPRIAVTAVQGNAVLAGAIQVGLDVVRDEIFTATGRAEAAEGTR
jgi:predicted NBD/HSP70 family sugar kinase